MANAHDVGRMTDREIASARDAGAVAILPVGALEQHGVHLPVDTDAVSAHRVALEAARRSEAETLVFPPLTYGFSPHHLSRPGTISLSLDIFAGQIRDAVRCLAASGFARVLLVNGHGGNVAPLRAVVTELVTDGFAVSSVDYWGPARSDWEPILKGKYRSVGHACEFETALQLVLRDDELASAIAARIRDLPPRLDQPFVASGGIDGFTPAGAVAPPIFLADDCGYYGDPAAATRATGEAIFECVTVALANFIDWFESTDLVLGGRPDTHRGR